MLLNNIIFTIIIIIIIFYYYYYYYASVLEKARKRKTNVEYYLSTKTQMVGACALLRDTIEGRMKGKASCGRKRLQMLSVLASSAKYMYRGVKRTAEDQE